MTIKIDEKTYTVFVTPNGTECKSIEEARYVAYSEQIIREAIERTTLDSDDVREMLNFLLHQSRRATVRAVIDAIDAWESRIHS